MTQFIRQLVNNGSLQQPDDKVLIKSLCEQKGYNAWPFMTVSKQVGQRIYLWSWENMVQLTDVCGQRQEAQCAHCWESRRRRIAGVNRVSMKQDNINRHMKLNTDKIFGSASLQQQKWLNFIHAPRRYRSPNLACFWDTVYSVAELE